MGMIDMNIVSALSILAEKSPGDRENANDLIALIARVKKTETPMERARELIEKRIDAHKLDAETEQRLRTLLLGSPTGITRITFYTLWKGAFESDADEFSYAEKYKRLASPEVLRRIFTSARLPFKDVIRDCGFTQAAFALRYCMNINTIKEWCMGRREPPSFVRLLIMRDLGYLDGIY